MFAMSYAEGSLIEDFQASRIFTHQTAVTTGILAARMPEHSLFLAQDGVVSTESWQGIKQPTREWGPGMVGFLPAGTEMTSIANNPYREMVVRIDTRFFSEAVRSDIDFDRIDFRWTEVTDPLVTQMTTMLHDIAKTENLRDWPLLVDSIGLALTVATIRQLSPRASTLLERIRSGMSAARKRRVVDFIEANIHRPISLGELAGAASMSPYHFSRSFKASLGVSPLRYVAGRRIEAAQALMRGAATSLAMVALSTGFSSQAHFNTAYRGFTGTTPGQYQDAHGHKGRRKDNELFEH